MLIKKKKERKKTDELVMMQSMEGGKISRVSCKLIKNLFEEIQIFIGKKN